MNSHRPIASKLMSLGEEPLGLGEPPREHDEKGEREIGDRFGVLAGRIDERYALRRRGFDIDVDRPTTGAAHQPQCARGCENSVGDRRSVNDKNLEPGHATGELRRLALELAQLQLGDRRRFELTPVLDLKVFDLMLSLEHGEGLLEVARRHKGIADNENVHVARALPRKPPSIMSSCTYKKCFASLRLDYGMGRRQDPTSCHYIMSTRRRTLLTTQR